MHNCKNLITDNSIIEFLNKEKNKNNKDVNNIYIWEWLIYGSGLKEHKKTEIFEQFMASFNYNLWSFSDLKIMFQNMLIYSNSEKILLFISKIENLFNLKINNDTINKILTNKNYIELDSFEKNLLIENSIIDLDNENNSLYFAFSNIFKSNKKYSLLNYIYEIQTNYNLDLSSIKLPINKFLELGETKITEYNLFDDDSLLTILIKIKDNEMLSKYSFPKQDVITDIIKNNELVILNSKLNTQISKKLIKKNKI